MEYDYFPTTSMLYWAECRQIRRVSAGEKYLQPYLGHTSNASASSAIRITYSMLCTFVRIEVLIGVELISVVLFSAFYSMCFLYGENIHLIFSFLSKCLLGRLQ